MITLPKESIPSVDDWTAYNFLIMGDPGIGKSGFVASIPDYLLVDPEGGLRGYPGYKVELKSWQDHKDLTTLLTKIPRSQYKGIALDSLNISYDHCVKYIITQMRISHPGEASQGQAWNRITSEFLSWLRELIYLGYHVVGTCHTNIVEVRVRNLMYNRWIPAFTGGSPTSTYFGVLKVFDIIGFMTIEEVVKPPTKTTFGKQVVDVRADTTDVLATEESRVIHFDESPYWLANNKCGKLPKTVVLTKDWRDDWRLIMEAWNTGEEEMKEVEPTTAAVNDAAEAGGGLPGLQNGNTPVLGRVK